MSAPSRSHNEQPHPLFTFFREISILEQQMRAKMERVLPDQMKVSHFSLLNRLVTYGGSETPAELAEAFQVSRPAITNTLQRLEANRYIRILPNPKDGRGKHVELTAIGRKAHGKAMIALQENFIDVSNELGLQTFETANPLLQRVRVYMDENR